MMYRCLDCKEHFRDPREERVEEWSEFWGRPVAEVIVRDRCPYCGSEDITEVNECEACGEPTERIFCDECHRELDEYLDAIKYAFKIDHDQLQELIVEHFGW